jgi:hypothetical protein
MSSHALFFCCNFFFLADIALSFLQLISITFLCSIVHLLLHLVQLVLDQKWDCSPSFTASNPKMKGPTTHIADHIHEWHQRHILCKEETTKEQCLDWFIKLLVPVIAKDVASIFPQSKEEAIKISH